ncbi:MAG TPA: hypothetical protein VM686_37800, partial [Polyangiaceae bacterium]|nr:hypothetical protein [Polyangiaceae bacterium]
MNDRSHLEEAARILRLMRDARDEPDSARAYRFMMAAAKRHTEWLQADAAIATAPAWRPGLGDWVRPKGNHEHEAGRVTAIRWDTQYPIAVRWYPSGTTGGWMASDLEPATPSAQESSANPSNSSNSSPPEATPTSPCETCGDPVEHLVPRFCHIHEPPSADDWEPGIVGARLDVEQERAHSACLGGHPLYRCRRCGCPVTDHATDDEERRECTACECEQYEMCPGCAQQQASPERGTGGEDFEPPCGRCKGRGVMWHERLERDVLCTYCQTKPVANA